MRLLVTGAGGLIGSNLAVSAVQQSWSVLGTWRGTPVSLPGARTAQLDVADRHACVRLAEELEPDVVIHAAAESSPARLEREPGLAELELRGAENTLAAAHTVRARYVLVSCEHVFSGLRPAPERWQEEDPTEPISAIGRSRLACERLTERFGGSWLITRPADVYGINLSVPADAIGCPPTLRPPARRPPFEHPSAHRPIEYAPALAAAAHAARARHVWERSGPTLRWVAWLRAGQPLPAPAGVLRTSTYAWDYAQVVCELIAQECEGVFNTAGPTILGRLAYLRLLARAFECDMRLVQEGSPAAFLRACGEWVSATGETLSSQPLPANTALCDRKASFVLGRSAIDPFTGHRLMRRQLERLLGQVGRTGREHAIGEPHATDGPVSDGRAGDAQDVEGPAANGRDLDPAWGGLG